MIGNVEKVSATSFSPVTCENVEISRQNILTFSCISFATHAQNFRTMPSSTSKLLKLSQEHLSKKLIFCQIVIKVGL